MRPRSVTRRIDTTLIVLAALGVLLTGLPLLGGESVHREQAVASGIDVAPRVGAGETVDVVVRSSADDGAQIPLYVVTAVAGFERVVTIVGGRGAVSIGESLTGSAGVVTLAAPGADGVLTRSFEVLPGAAAGRLVPLVGPRTIVADGQDHTMVVVVPVDARGNMVADRTEILVSARHPGGDLLRTSISTTHGLAHTTLRSGTTAGTATVAAASGAATGPAIEFTEVAGSPREIALSADERELWADGRTLHRVTTQPLVDLHGNAVPDGVVVGFTIVDPSGVRHLSGVVLGGRAEVFYEAPDQPGQVRVSAAAVGVSSEPLVLEFRPAVAEVPAVVREVEGQSVVHLGPVTDVLGATVPEGTEATVGGRVVVLKSGRASVVVDRLDDVVVEVLGVMVAVTVAS